MRKNNWHDDEEDEETGVDAAHSSVLFALDDTRGAIQVLGEEMVYTKDAIESLIAEMKENEAGHEEEIKEFENMMEVFSEFESDLANFSEMVDYMS